MKSAEVRYYFDEDILLLAHTIARLRSDCTYPGDPGAVIHRRQRPECPIARGSKDTVWVPAVAARGWVIVTRDHNIRENPAERRAVRENGARMVALAGEDGRNTWGQLELFMRYWRQIEEAASRPGPFIYLASRSRMRLLDLAD
ncbi:MAG TPA: hypothetical protein VMF51_07490 [Nocardioides sp.]|uniref:PIN-like domain-containing protein n=1 Tax=Nocardioides sp. TaxID=35761 RepID=UPI002B7705B1|nr:hypothetical protein [Nocardioides sp.]HTW14955.1 hypothetical protein [Nocardioides sp.]